MHELGVVFEVIKKVEAIVKANGLTQVDTIVLQIGELSSMIPRYIEACYPAAVDGTMLEATKLKIEILPGKALCNDCKLEYNFNEQQMRCPTCGCERFALLGGKEFMIKEIIAC